MNAEIITIGDEILIGQVIDTNSAFLGSELNKIGISVIQITSIPDKRENILRALEDAKSRAGLIIITGGLGPTSDDITKPALAEYFGSRLVENQAVLKHIENLFGARSIKMNDRNRKQAEVPHNCSVLHNSEGTAPGMWFQQDDTIFVSLPGVPFEMKAIYTRELGPALKKQFDLPPIYHLTILTHGVGESDMAARIQAWEEALPDQIKLAYLPSPGILRLRISGKPVINGEDVVIRIKEEAKKLAEIIGPHIFGQNNDTLEELVGKLLRENGFSLSLAESCTGGLVSSMITSVPGSSSYYKGGIVAYSNELKTNELNVSPYTLMINGAVSQPVVEQMAEGIRTRFSTDFSLAVSGVAGPSGGSPEKPVGTTWIAVSSAKRILSHAYNFGEERGRNMQKAAIAALFMLRNEIRDCL